MKGENVVFLVVIGFLVGAIFGTLMQRNYHRGEAVEAGVAHYLCDATTGKVEFKFIVPAPKQGG